MMLDVQLINAVVVCHHGTPFPEAVKRIQCVIHLEGTKHDPEGLRQHIHHDADMLVALSDCEER